MVLVLYPSSNRWGRTKVAAEAARWFVNPYFERCLLYRVLRDSWHEESAESFERSWFMLWVTF